MVSHSEGTEKAVAAEPSVSFCLNCKIRAKNVPNTKVMSYMITFIQKNSKYFSRN